MARGMATVRATATLVVTATAIMQALLSPDSSADLLWARSLPVAALPMGADTGILPMADPSITSRAPITDQSATGPTAASTMPGDTRTFNASGSATDPSTGLNSASRESSGANARFFRTSPYTCVIHESPDSAQAFT